MTDPEPPPLPERLGELIARHTVAQLPVERIETITVEDVLRDGAMVLERRQWDS